MKAKLLTIISGLAFLLAANHGFASPEYVDLIPNGSVNSCLTCHVNADPNTSGTTRNSFGLAWRNNTPARTYNALLASKDSDIDTFTNGQELGDPAGTWVVGNPNPPGPVFNPGNAASHPTASTPPAITSAPPPATSTVGTSYNFTVTATGTAPITFTASGLPGGLAISGAGAISGTPTTAGTFNGTITAANGTLPDATQAFTIVISEAPVAPTITSAPLPASGTVGTSYNFTVTATGTAPITFTASGLPGGLAISSAGAISGAPTAAGTFNGTITAANGTLPNATQPFSIVISTAPVAPTITSAPLPASGTVGTSYNFTVTATGTAPITFTASGLPGGLAISSAGAISGAPTAAGTFNGTITAANGTLPNATQPFSIVISTASAAPTITVQPVSRTVTVGATVSFTVAATGSAPLTYQWQKDTIDMPGAASATLTLSSVNTTDAGSYRAIVSNADGSATSAAATLTVNPASEISITLISPTNGQVFTAPARIKLVAEVNDPEGTVTNVEFFAGDTSLGARRAKTDDGDEDEDNQAGSRFSLNWKKVPAGTYVLTARSTDNLGVTRTSDPIMIEVVSPPNLPPSVRVLHPENGNRFIAGRNIGLVARASDKDGTVASVEFFAGDTSLGIAEFVRDDEDRDEDRDEDKSDGHSASGMYLLVWQGVPAGQYIVTARAVDNGGASTVSESIRVSVTQNRRGGGR